MNTHPQHMPDGKKRLTYAKPFAASDTLFSLRYLTRETRLALWAWLQKNSFAPRWLPARWRHPFLGYCIAVILEFSAASLTLLSISHLPIFALQGVLVTLGIVLVALNWGAGPGLLASFVGTLLLDFIVLPSYFAWFMDDAADSICAMAFLLIGFSISLIAGQNGRARRHAEELAQSLKEEQTRTERERRRLRALLDVLPAAVGMMDAQGRVVETNRANQALWGDDAPRPGETAQFESWRGWWPDTGKPIALGDWAIIRALTKGEAVINQEVEVETSAGQRKVILDSAAPIRDKQGAIIGGASIHQDITERKRLEEALRESERRAAAHAAELEAIFEAMTDGLLVYDVEGRIVRCNIAARQLLGFDARPDVLSLPFYTRASHYRPLDEKGQPFPHKELALHRILRGEVVTSGHAADERLHALNGRELSISITGRPLRSSDGTISGAVAIVRDVTERRRLEREVAERAAQLETIFESMVDGIIVTDRQGRIVHMNQAGRTLLGIKRDPKGLTMPELEALEGFSPRNAQEQPLTNAERPITRYLQGEVLTRQQSVDLIVQTHDGREMQVNNAGAPIYDAQGTIIGAVEVVRDVTEQRRLQQHTSDTLNALLAMAEELVQPPDQAPAGKCAAPEANLVARRLAELTRSVLGCQYVSIAAVAPGTEAMTPITVVGLSPNQEQRWWADWQPQLHFGDRLQPEAVAALRAGEPVLLDKTQSPLPIWQYITPQGKSLMVPMRVGETLVGILRIGCEGVEEGYACPNKRALIRAVARLGALVLERERLLCERAKAQASELALREANAQMDTFLGMAGHELKTPLTSIKLALQLAERRIQQLAQRKPGIASSLTPFLEQATRAGRQAERLDRLINDLLDVSRVQAGKLELQPEPVDLAAIVREAVEEQRQAAPDRVLILSFPPDLRVPVTADAARIGQVVTNYLTNALKYSAENRPVEVGIGLEGPQARVWVRDEGPGLSAEEQEHIWERFHRAKGIEVQSGTGIGLGLGLHICRTIIERHQGQVGVDSAPGKGSTFWFTLSLDSQGTHQPAPNQHPGV